MKREIYRALDGGYLTYEPDNAFVGVPLLEELVGLCDQDAENRNAHDFVGAHRLLGAVLFRQYGRYDATKTMLTIAEFGGLQGMAGVCSAGDAYGELGVGKAGHDWNGEYK